MRVVPGIDIKDGHVLASSLYEPHLAEVSFNFFNGSTITTDTPSSVVQLWDKAPAVAVGDLRYVLGTLWRVYQCRIAVAANTDTRPDRDDASWVDAGPYEVVWVAKNYALGDRVIRRETHRTYYALRAVHVTETTPPEDAPTVWQDIGSTNAYALFDKYRNSPSIDPMGSTQTWDAVLPYAPLSSGEIDITIKPGKRIDSVLLAGLDGTDLAVIMRNAANTVIATRTMKLRRRLVRNWADYFFAPLKPKRAVSLFGLPLSAGATLRINIVNTTGPAKCGCVLIDRAIYVGDFEYGVSSDADNYSEIDRDKYGSAKITPHRSVPKVVGSLFAPAALADVYMELRDTLNGVPAGWVGVDNQPNHAYHDSLFLIGIYRRLADRKAGPTHIKCDIELEEI